MPQAFGPTRRSPSAFGANPVGNPAFFFSDLPSTFAAAISAASLPMPSACMVCLFSAMRALRSCSYGASPSINAGGGTVRGGRERGRGGQTRRDARLHRGLNLSFTRLIVNVL